jgi:hypothetical protein
MLLLEEVVMNITVRITNNFGNRAVYPVCDTARKLADLIGTKTFTDRAIAQIQSLGYTVSVQQPTL